MLPAPRVRSNADGRRHHILNGICRVESFSHRYRVHSICSPVEKKNKKTAKLS